MNDFDSFPAAVTVRRLVEILDYYQCQYWLDSGTLLWSIREGYIRDDDDFDVSVFVSGDAIDNVLLLILSHFSKVRLCMFGDIIFKLKIEDVSGVMIDLNLFRMVGGVLCCPQKVRPVFWYMIPNWLRRMFAFICENTHPKTFPVYSVLVPNHNLYHISTWLIPFRYIGSNRYCNYRWDQDSACAGF